MRDVLIELFAFSISREGCLWGAVYPNSKTTERPPSYYPSSYYDEVLYRANMGAIQEHLAVYEIPFVVQDDHIYVPFVLEDGTVDETLLADVADIWNELTKYPVFDDHIYAKVSSRMFEANFADTTYRLSPEQRKAFREYLYSWDSLPEAPWVIDDALDDFLES